MKHIIYKFGIIAFVALSFYACDENSFEQVVTYDIPEEEPRLVTYAEFNDKDSLLFPLVGRSIGVNSTRPDDRMDKAKIELFKDNNLIMAFKPLTDSALFYDKVRYYTSTKKATNIFKDDTDYKLVVTYAPYKTIESTVRPPKKVDIIGVEYNPNKFVSADGGKSDEVLVEFVDPPGENFYKFSIYIGIKPVFSDKVEYQIPYIQTSTTNNDLFGSGDAELTITDAAFNGKKYKFRCGITIQNNGGYTDPKTGVFITGELKDMIVRMTSIPKEAYYYEKSFQQYENTQDNPLAEPTQINTNIKNGFGFFSIGRVSEKVFKF